MTVSDMHELKKSAGHHILQRLKCRAVRFELFYLYDTGGPPLGYALKEGWGGGDSGPASREKEKKIVGGRRSKDDGSLFLTLASLLDPP
jgi:hypothetical protein